MYLVRFAKNSRELEWLDNFIPSFLEPGNQSKHGSDLQVFYLSLNITEVHWPQQALVSGAKIHLSYV